MADQGRLGEFSKIYILDLTPSLLGGTLLALSQTKSLVYSSIRHLY